jgi:hypothetical protein
MKWLEFILKIFIGLPPVIGGSRLEINKRIDALLEADCRRKK